MISKIKELMKKDFSFIVTVLCIPLWIYVFIKTGISDIYFLLLIVVVLHYIITFYRFISGRLKSHDC